MASPFDLYQQQQFDGLDPNKFNKDYYAELQKSLFANTLKDQLLGLQGAYNKELELQGANKQQIEAASKKLEELNAKSQSYQNAFKEAERAVNSTKNMINSYLSTQKEYETRRDRARDEANNYTKIITQLAADMKKLAKDKAGGNASRLRGADLAKYNQIVSSINSYGKKRTQANTAYKLANEAVGIYSKKISDEKRNVLNPREQALKQANDAANAHIRETQNTAAQVDNLTKAIGTSSSTAQKALDDAQALQDKITNYQARSEPLRDLQTKIEGDYAASTKASTEELKQIAANSLDPISQRNAQNLLNQRAQQIAQTFGKDVNAVRDEMMAGLGTPLPEQQFSQEEFNKFMGIEAAKEAELQNPGALNNLQEQIMPQPAPSQVPAAGSPEQATIQPFGEPQLIAQPALTATPPQPVQPPQVQQQAPQAQQLQNQAQVQTSGMPANPAPAPQPQQPNVPQQQAATQQSSGMPKPPAPQPQAAFGAINPYIKQGMASQLRQGFQNAMKIKATPRVDPMVSRRQAVASQAMGTPQKPVSVSQKPEAKPFGQDQNVQVKTQQNTVNSGAGRRQPR